MSRHFRLGAVDVGNDSIKAIFNSLETEMNIPNVIAETTETRNFVELEKNPLDGLHVEITSRALKSGKGIYAVGKLASKYLNNDELTLGSEKSESDQSIIMLLTPIAIDAITCGEFEEKDGVIEAQYLLSTGLPLDEAKRGKRKTFREKLKSASHEVRFLDTPVYQGKTVRIKFTEIIVNTEGHAAMIDLTTNDDGSVRNEELTMHTVMITDIGGLSTDIAILTPEGIDNVNSDGMRDGVSPYLDQIIDQVARETRYQFQSRQELVEVITNQSPVERNHIYSKGNRTSIQSIVDTILMQLAKSEYRMITKMWEEKVPSIRYSYLIGGGALIIKPYIEQLNEKGNQYPLRFLSQKESVWIIARAYFKLLLIYMNEKGIKVAAPAKTAVKG